MTLFGAEAGDLSGLSVYAADDINADGFDDLIIGAPSARSVGNARIGAGESYIVLVDHR